MPARQTPPSSRTRAAWQRVALFGAKHRSGTHTPRREFGEDSEWPESRGNFPLWLWIPAFAGMTAEWVGGGALLPPASSPPL
jgi:hypothetical protein